MNLPTYCRAEAHQAYCQHLADLHSGEGLFRAACAVALHERPEADLSEAEATVGKLSDLVRGRVCSASPHALLAHLHDVLFDQFGLRGNTGDYYNPANSYIPDVLATRQGIPITLVLVYKRVAEPLGLTVHGVNSPGHFLAEVEAPGGSERMYIDPFFGGGMLTREEVYERVAQATGRVLPPTPNLLARASHRQWLYRILMNLQAAFSALGQDRDVCAMQELQTMLA